MIVECKVQCYCSGDGCVIFVVQDPVGKIRKCTACDFEYRLLERSMAMNGWIQGFKVERVQR